MSDKRKSSLIEAMEKDRPMENKLIWPWIEGVLFVIVAIVWEGFICPFLTRQTSCSRSLCPPPFFRSWQSRSGMDICPLSLARTRLSSTSSRGHSTGWGVERLPIFFAGVVQFGRHGRLKICFLRVQVPPPVRVDFSRFCDYIVYDKSGARAVRPVPAKNG